MTWALIACVGVAAAASASGGDSLWAGLGVAAVAVTLIPAVATRRLTAALPWEVSLFVAAVGYVTVRAFEVHDPDVFLPRKFATAFILLFTMAFGVLWGRAGRT